MIPYKLKAYPETIISRRRIPQLEVLLEKIEDRYIRILPALIESFPSAKTLIHERSDDLGKWLEDPLGSSKTLEIFRPQDGTPALFILEAKKIRGLQTEWAERHKKKNAFYLIANGFLASNLDASIYNEFCEVFGNAIRETFNLINAPSFTSINIINELYVRLENLPRTDVAISKDQIPALYAMTDTQFRNTIIRTRQAKDPTLVNISKSTGLENAIVANELNKATELGILQRMHNVICLSCSSSIAQIGDLSALVQMQENEVSCPNCHRPLTEDSYVDSFFLKPDFGSLLDGSKWMEILLRMELDRYLNPVRVLIGVIDGPNELDLVANVDGALILMELKDNRFSIGHAYSFVGKYSQYRPDISVIVATDGIDEDVKEYIRNTGVETMYIPNLQSISTDLAEILTTLNSQKLAQLLSDVPWGSFMSRSITSCLGIDLPIPEERVVRYGSSIRTPPDLTIPKR